MLFVRPSEGGVGYVSRRLAEQLRRDGAEVREVVLSDPAAPAWTGLTAAWRHRGAICSAGAVHIEIGRTTKSPFWFAVAALLARPDVTVVAHDLPEIVGRPAAALLDVRGKWRSRLAHRLLSPILDRPLRAWVLTRAGVVGTFADAAQAGLWGLRRFGLLDLGCDPADTAHVPLPPSAGDAVVFAGFLAADKGIEELLSAWEQVGPGTNLSLVIAGEAGAAHAPWLAEQKRRGAGLPRPPRWTGPLDDTAFARLLGNAAVVVLPYRTSNPVSGVAVQAVVQGRPIVGTRVPALRASVEHESNGLLGPPGDTGAITEHLARLVADPRLRDRFGRESARRASERHTWARHAEGTRALHVLASRRRARLRGVGA